MLNDLWNRFEEPKKTQGTCYICDTYTTSSFPVQYLLCNECAPTLKHFEDQTLFDRWIDVCNEAVVRRSRRQQK